MQRRFAVLQRGVPAEADRDGRGKGDQGEMEARSQAFLPARGIQQRRKPPKPHKAVDAAV